MELAQLQYLLPRIMGQGASLSRLGGGIGTRGPGETKLEVDRRRIRDCIGFPKNNSGRDVMLDAPSEIDQTQLDELNLIVDIKENK